MDLTIQEILTDLVVAVIVYALMAQRVKREESISEGLTKEKGELINQVQKAQSDLVSHLEANVAVIHNLSGTLDSVSETMNEVLEAVPESTKEKIIPTLEKIETETIKTKDIAENIETMLKDKS